MPELELREPRLVTVAATGIWERGARTRIRVRDFAPIVMDEPEAVGGTDQGPNPMEYVMAALDGCAAVMVNLVAQEMDFRYRSLALRSEGTLDLRGLMGAPGVRRHFQRVQLKVTLHTDEPPARVQELRSRVDNRCPALNLLRDAGIPVEEEWVTQGT